MTNEVHIIIRPISGGNGPIQMWNFLAKIYHDLLTLTNVPLKRQYTTIINNLGWNFFNMDRNLSHPIRSTAGSEIDSYCI